MKITGLFKINKVKQILTKLNEVGNFLKQTLKNANISLKSNENWESINSKWYFNTNADYIEKFNNTYPKREVYKSFVDDGNITTITAITARIATKGYSFEIDSLKAEKYLLIDIYFGYDYRQILFEDIKLPGNFTRLLLDIFLKNKMHISFKDYINLRKERESSIERIDELRQTIIDWLQGSTYTKTLKIGKKIEKLISYMPSKVQKSPTNTLFRVMLVKEPLFEKLLTQNKPLILKNRKYSSWTYDFKGIKGLGTIKYIEKGKGFIPVVFQKTFEDNEILLNLTATLKYLQKWGRDLPFEYEHTLNIEREIIVKNSGDIFKFTCDNIYAYRDKKWIFY